MSKKTSEAKKERLPLETNGGTRTGIDRRQYFYSAYIPERRSGKDRRKRAFKHSNVIRKRKN